MKRRAKTIGHDRDTCDHCGKERRSNDIRKTKGPYIYANLCQTCYRQAKKEGRA